jgi:toxin HigB-1
MSMEIASIRHRHLRAFAETGTNRGLIEAYRLSRMLEFIADAASFEELADPPNYGFHALTGSRKGVYAMTVTRNCD